MSENNMTPLDQTQLKALLEKATPGPWDFDGDWQRFPTIVGPAGDNLMTVEKLGFPDRCNRTERHEANASLAALAPTLAETVLTLQARVEELEAEKAQLLARMSDMMPIAGGNPFKQMSKTHGVAALTKEQG